MTEEELEHFGILGMHWGKRGLVKSKAKKPNTFLNIKLSKSEKQFLKEHGPTIKKGAITAGVLAASYATYKLTHYPSALSMVDGVLTLTMPPGSITTLSEATKSVSTVIR